MNDVCPGCKKANHPGGCKLPDLPPKKAVEVDPDFEAKRDASFQGRQWKPMEREDEAEKVAQAIEKYPEILENKDPNKDFLDISGLHPAMADLLRDCVQVLGSKGHDYTEGSSDRLNNFREAAVEVDSTMEKVWHTFFFKHWKAVRSWIRFGKVESEPIRNRILDCINYFFLLWLIVREKDPSQD